MPPPDYTSRPNGPEAGTGPGDPHDRGAAPASAGRSALLAPFIAWMATQPLDEVTRRRHRRAVEAYLTWSRADDGPTTGRRRRYERQLTREAPNSVRDARAGLDRYAEYREIVARTIPVDR